METRIDQINLGSNVTVVMYHYVRDLANSRYPDIKGLDNELFINQIEYLKRNYAIVTTEEVINSITTGEKLPPKAALLTFDDGYIDHYTNVFPILSNYGLQGTFYIPAKAIEENVVLDVNKIHFILASSSDKAEVVRDIKTMIKQNQAEYNLLSFDHYYKKLAVESRYDSKEVIFIKRILQVELQEELRLKIVDKLFAKYVQIEESIFAKELYMNKEQLLVMKRNGMHIGCHGYNHYWWNSLTREQLVTEIDKSLAFLKQIDSDLSKWTACYPYGSFDDQAVEVLTEKGCKMAFTTKVGVANTKMNNSLLMPRLDTNDLPKLVNGKYNTWYNLA